MDLVLIMIKGVRRIGLDHYQLRRSKRRSLSRIRNRRHNKIDSINSRNRDYWFSRSMMNRRRSRRKKPKIKHIKRRY